MLIVTVPGRAYSSKVLAQPAGRFETAGTTVAGVCDPSCDPLTQDLKVGTAKAACGSTNPAMPTKGCYGYDEFNCAPGGMSTWTLTDRQMAQR